jgi:hypothetical protein
VVRRGDGPARVARLARGDLVLVGREVVSTGALDVAKRALGNQRYEVVRGLALGLLRRR